MLVRGMLRRALAIFIVATMIVSSQSFYVLAQGLNEASTEEAAGEESLEGLKNEEESVELDAESLESDAISEDKAEKTEAEEKSENFEENKEDSALDESKEEAVLEPGSDEEEEEKAPAEEPEDPEDYNEEPKEVKDEVETDIEEEKKDSENSEEELEPAKEEVIAEPETDAETSIEETTEETETEAETSAEMIPEEVAETVEAKKAGLILGIKFTYDRFLSGDKRVTVTYNNLLWEPVDDIDDPNSMWIIDTSYSNLPPSTRLVCNFEKFADGTYSIEDFDYPTFVSKGYGYDENGRCWAYEDLSRFVEYYPIMAPGEVTWYAFDEIEISDVDKRNYGEDFHENFRNHYLDDWYSGDITKGAPGGMTGRLILVVGNGLTELNSEAAYYIPLYLNPEERDERFNRIVEDLKSRFGDDLYIRGLAGGVGRFNTFNTSTVVQDATAVAFLFPDQYESLILTATGNHKYFLVFGFTSRDAGKTYRLGIDERLGHFTNETGIDEEGYFTYTYQSRETDIIVPTVENHKNGISFNTSFRNPDTGGTVTASESSLINSLNSWLKTKGSAWNSQTFMAEFGGSFFNFRFDNASHLTKTGTLGFAPKDLFNIVPPTIQKYNGSHYIFDKWLDADGNEIADINEFISAFIDNPAAHANAYAYEKLIEEKIIFDMTDFTEDMGTYEGDTEFYLDDTNWTPPTINCNPDYSFVGWSKEKYATALVSLDEIIAEITEWKENPEGNKVYYPVFRGKPMLRYTVDTSKGTVYDMPHGKMTFKYDEYTSDELFAARPEINGNFGYNFIGWNINSQYVELDDVANIIDTWAFDPAEDLILEAAFESVGTLTLNIDTTKIEIADDPTGVQEANQIKLDGKTTIWPGITFNTIDDDIVFLGFGTGDELIIPIDEIADEYPGLMNQNQDLVYDTIYRNKARFTFNTTGIDGKGSISGTLSFKEDEVSSITAPTVTDNNDYEFLGWTKNTSTNELISIDDAILDWNIPNDYSLYPVFKTLYNVIYTVRSSDSNKATVDFTGLTYEFKMPKQALTNTSAVENIVNSKPDSAITRNKGYKFTGWSLNDEALTASNLATAINTATSDINIYAEFESLRLFTVNIDTGNFHIAGDSLTTQLIYDSEDTFAPGISFTNTINSGKKLLGFGTGTTATVATDGLKDAFDAWKTTLPMADVAYNGILRNIYKINVINDTNYSTEPDRTYRENNNASSEVISITPFIAKQGYMNSGFALTEGGTALTSDELDDMLNPWMYDSDITLYALYEEDPSVMRARFHIDISKLDTTLTDGNVELFTISDFEALINELKDAQPIGNNIVSWMQDGVKLTSLEDAVWDGTSTTVIEPVFTVKLSPAPARGTSGGGGGGSSSSSSSASYNGSYGAKPTVQNFSITVKSAPIFSKAAMDPAETSKYTTTSLVTTNYSWVTNDGHTWSLVDLNSNTKFTDGWAYLECAGDYGWYHFDKEGNMVAGWLNDNGNTYFLAPKDNKLNMIHGKMVTGTHLIDGRLYTFDSSGKLVSME